MNRKSTKAMVCAVAAAMMISGSSYHTRAAAGTSAFLPAAGLGLTLGEGVSISVIREDVKKKKAEETKKQKINSKQNTEESSTGSGTNTAETEKGSKGETGTASTETASKEQKTETQSTGENEETVSRETEHTQETEIVEAVEPQVKETAPKESEETDEKQDRKETLVIAQVSDYVNIRSTPGTDGEVVGKLYDNSVGTLLSSQDGWYKIKSGNVEGYVKAEFFKTGTDAKKLADEVGNKIATVNTTTLKVRESASLDAPVLGMVPNGEELTVLAEENGFVKVSIEEGDGWVSVDYVNVDTEYVTAESTHEERERLEKEERAKEEARKAAEAAEEKLREEERKREEEQKKKEEEKKKKEEEKKAQEEARREEESRKEEEEKSEDKKNESRDDSEENADEEEGHDSDVSGNDAPAEESDSDDREEEESKEEQKESDSEESSESESSEEESSEEIVQPSLSSSGSIGHAVADYAKQFVGRPYVYGGTSLTNGADCSGFVMSVYKNFGVSLPHSSSADRNVGYNVGSLSNAQPGDLICYSGHVGIYIGDGQIVHASTEKTGIKISDADYRNPVAVRRIF